MPDQSLDLDANSATSDATGHFLVGFGTTQYDRMIMLSREGKKLEGISTLDLIALQAHLSGESPITEPHKLYAADLDGNGRVGANDLQLMKKALLGGFKLDTYRGDLSWVFFGDPCDPDAPLDLLENVCHNGIEVDHTGSFPMVTSFKALKMGDVNGDMVNMAWNLTPRTSSAVKIAVRENASFNAIEFMLVEDAVVYGMQMSLNNLNLEVTSGILPIQQSNLAKDIDGYTNLSWGQTAPIAVKAGEVLFTLENMAPGVQPENLLVDHLESLFPEIYTENLNNELIKLVPYEASSVNMAFESKISPNPFTDYTTLDVFIPAGEEFFVTVHDIKGQELFKRRYVSNTNKAEIVIGSEVASIPGVYYYKVVSALGQLSGKFIRQ